MLNRRKIIAFVLGGIAVIAIITLVIIAAIVNQKDSEQLSTDRQSTPSVSPSAETPDEATQAIDTFEDDYLQLARDVALVASSWDGAADHTALPATYEEAGMSPELAKEYKPVWATIFGDNITAEITSTVDGSPQIDQVEGTEGSYVWRVAVAVTFEGTWHANGTTRLLAPRTETWWLTIEQADNAVTAIDQPTQEQIDININEEES